MELLNRLEQQLDGLREKSLIRRRRNVETPCAPRVKVNGRELLAFCSNDYLGLAAHPRIAAAMHEGVELYGTGSGASHLIRAIAAPTRSWKSVLPNSSAQTWSIRARSTSAPATWRTSLC